MRGACRHLSRVLTGAQRDVGRGLAKRSVDHAGVERVALVPPQHVENVGCARVGAREGDGQLGGLKEDEVHGGNFLTQRRKEAEKAAKIHGFDLCDLCVRSSRLCVETPIPI